MKKIIITISVLLLCLLVFLAIMEFRCQYTTMEDAGLSEEEILKEMPAAAISEEDLKLKAYILGLPEVQEKREELAALQTDETAFAVFTDAEAEILLRDYIPEGCQVAELSLSIFNDAVYLTLSKDDIESLIYYTFFPGGEHTIYKTIGMYKPADIGRTCIAIYSNDNRGIYKEVPKHVWFGWLKELKKES